MLAKGTYHAHAVGAQIGFTSKGNEQIAVEFELTDEEYAGQHITWIGFFTEATTERTMESLRHCGWHGDDITEAMRDGLAANEVQLVIDHEVYEGKTQVRVRWVNKPGSGGGMKLRAPMDDAQKRQFAAKMKAQAVASRMKAGVKPAPAREPGADDDELGF